MKKGIRITIHAIGVALLVAIDQIAKWMVRTYLTGGRSIVIWDGVFKLVSHRNTGAVWGIFHDKTDMLSIVTIIILGAVIFFYFRMPWDRPKLRHLRRILVFVCAGAIGNLIDRIWLKYVVDFLYFELIDFPVFNIADCYITVSMFLLIILFFAYYREEDFDFLDRKKKPAAEEPVRKSEED